MTTTIRCPKCDGRGHALTDVLIGRDRGQPLFEQQTRQCRQCNGRGRLYPAGVGVATVR